MKSLLWFVLGIASGFVLSHLVDKDPRGQKVLSEIDSRISEFTDRMSDAYHEQEARFSGTDNSSPLPAPEPTITPDDTDAPGYPVPTPKDVAEHTTVPQVSALADAAADSADTADAPDTPETAGAAPSAPTDRTD